MTPMNLKTVIEKIGLEPISAIEHLDRPVAGGYASDLLSCAMRGAKNDFLWVTLQSHANVVAVASLLSLAGVIITEGNRPAPEVVSQAEKEKVVLFLSDKDTYYMVGQLTALGVSGD